MNIRKFVKSLPYSLKQGIKYIYGAVPPSIRYGKAFWETYNFLQVSQWWNREELENYQIVQLKNLIKHAYENVLYYTQLFKSIDLHPDDFKKIEDLKNIPYLTKDIISKNSISFTAKNFNKDNLYIAHTSGTTGKPLQWHISLEEDQKEYAFICHQWSRIGFMPGDKVIQIRGNVIENKKKYQYDEVFKILRLSPKINSKEVARYYLNLIHNFGGKFIHGYPSSIAMFAHVIRENKLSIPFKLKSVLFASESVYQWQRKITEEVFDCRVYSHYGNAEKVVLAGECEKTNRYHAIPQYGITEFYNNEIVGTSFINYVTPFIRYRTTDVADGLDDNGVCSCGRHYFPNFDTVEGRLEDFIITAGGEFISPAVVTHPFKDFKQIKNTQIYQKDYSFIELRVIPVSGYNKTELKIETDKLVYDLKSIIGSNVTIKTDIVGKLQFSSSGKFRWIISEVSKKSLEDGFS